MILTSRLYKNELEELKQKQTEREETTKLRLHLMCFQEKKRARTEKLGKAGPSGISGKKKKFKIVPGKENVDIVFHKEYWYCFL